MNKQKVLILFLVLNITQQEFEYLRYLQWENAHWSRGNEHGLKNLLNQTKTRLGTYY